MLFLPEKVTESWEGRADAAVPPQWHGSMYPVVTHRASQGILFSSWTIFPTSSSLFWIDRDGNEEEIKISRPRVPPRQQQHRSWLWWKLWDCRSFSSLWGLAGGRTTKSSPPWAWSATVHSRLFQIHCHHSSGRWDIRVRGTARVWVYPRDKFYIHPWRWRGFFSRMAWRNCQFLLGRLQELLGAEMEHTQGIERAERSSLEVLSHKWHKKNYEAL